MMEHGEAGLAECGLVTGIDGLPPAPDHAFLLPAPLCSTAGQCQAGDDDEGWARPCPPQSPLTHLTPGHTASPHHSHSVTQ